MRAIHIYSHPTPTGKIHRLLFIPFSFLFFVPPITFIFYLFILLWRIPTNFLRVHQDGCLAADCTAACLPCRSDVCARVPVSPCARQVAGTGSSTLMAHTVALCPIGALQEQVCHEDDRAERNQKMLKQVSFHSAKRQKVLTFCSCI